MEKEKVVVILLRETWWQSLVSDAGSFATFAGLIGLGWFLDSSAMQWAGFFIGVFLLFARATVTGKSRRSTIAQARQKLDELERETP